MIFPSNGYSFARLLMVVFLQMFYKCYTLHQILTTALCSPETGCSLKLGYAFCFIYDHIC